MVQPRVLVLTGYGINCDFETQTAFELAGARAERVHINEVVSGGKRLLDYQIVVFPGGFSFGDDIASGKVLAVKVRQRLGDEILEFIEAGRLILGICNGFQVLVKFGLLADRGGDYRTPGVTLTFNDSGRYEDRWVHLSAGGADCVWTRGIDRMFLPVAHGEGKFYTTPDRLAALEEARQVVFRYADSEGRAAEERFPLNPNGSLHDIAAICDPTGRIMGMMPHPERFLFFTNHPHFPRLREQFRRAGKEPPEEGEGLQIFRNGVSYFA